MRAQGIPEGHESTGLRVEPRLNTALFRCESLAKFTCELARIADDTAI